MKKFNFYQDTKVITWERDHFTVEGESYEEAVSIVRSWNCKDVTGIIDDRLTLGESESLPEYSEPMSLEDNDGYATREIFNDDNDSILNNSLHGKD